MKQLVKSMDRHFTDDEGIEILSYWEQNKEQNLTEIIEYFEHKFNMPITETGISLLFVRKELGEI